MQKLSLPFTVTLLALAMTLQAEELSIERLVASPAIT